MLGQSPSAGRGDEIVTILIAIAQILLSARGADMRVFAMPSVAHTPRASYAIKHEHMHGIEKAWLDTFDIHYLRRNGEWMRQKQAHR